MEGRAGGERAQRGLCAGVSDVEDAVFMCSLPRFLPHLPPFVLSSSICLMLCDVLLA
jgi:hypothetical protein